MDALAPDMLLLADRGFFSFALWEKVKATGADLLWRTKSHHVLPVRRHFADGSYLSTIYPSTKDRRHQDNGVKVRVVEYSLGEGDDVTYRCLLTTMLDPKAASATKFAALYKERWEIESALDELKSHQRSPRVVLRSKMPDGVLQEAYAYLCVHFAIRWLMHSVALVTDEDPDRLTFTRTLRVARRSTGAMRESCGWPGVRGTAT
jgi:IS4 transposase